MEPGTYYARNREARLQYYRNNREERLDYQNERYRKDPVARHKQRGSYLKNRYGLSSEEWNAMFENQGRRCACCHDTAGAPVWCVDHYNVPGYDEMPPERKRLYVRAIICSRCNKAIGCANECTKRMRNMARYIDFHDRAEQTLDLRASLG